MPLNTLPSTYETIDAAYDAAITAGNATTVHAKNALATTTANATDHVTTPFAAACVSCHDAASTQSHIKLQGGQIQVNRNTVGAVVGESCTTCHGAGKSEDPAVVHK